MVLTGFCR
jgi:hypothetical protein